MPIGLFQNQAKANLVRERLAMENIKAEVREYVWWEAFWFVPKSASYPWLEVAAEQFERAEDMLLAWDNQGMLTEAIHCPECHSLRVDYPQMTRKSILTNCFMGLGAQFRLVSRDFYCQDCHYTWPNQGSRLSKLRPHSAPYYFIEGIPAQQIPVPADAE